MTTKGERKAPARYAGLCKVSVMYVPGASVFPNSSTSFSFLTLLIFHVSPSSCSSSLRCTPSILSFTTTLGTKFARRCTRQTCGTLWCTLLKVPLHPESDAALLNCNQSTASKSCSLLRLYPFAPLLQCGSCMFVDARGCERCALMCACTWVRGCVGVWVRV